MNDNDNNYLLKNVDDNSLFKCILQLFCNFNYENEQISMINKEEVRNIEKLCMQIININIISNEILSLLVKITLSHNFEILFYLIKENLIIKIINLIKLNDKEITILRVFNVIRNLFRSKDIKIEENTIKDAIIFLDKFIDIKFVSNIRKSWILTLSNVYAYNNYEDLDYISNTFHKLMNISVYNIEEDLEILIFIQQCLLNDNNKQKIQFVKNDNLITKLDKFFNKYYLNEDETSKKIIILVLESFHNLICIYNEFKKDKVINISEFLLNLGYTDKLEKIIDLIPIENDNI